MYSIGETVFYGPHGVCFIEDIQELTFSEQKKQYYILRSHQNKTLTLYHPVKTENPKISPLPSKQKAELILETFQDSSIDWIERAPDRAQSFKAALESNNPMVIAQMVNGILRKKAAMKLEHKNILSQDAQVLKQVLPILLDELAFSLNQSTDEVMQRIKKILEES